MLGALAVGTLIAERPPRDPGVLVSHSAGGLYMRLFADRRPREIVGMVLVDPSIEHQDQRFAAVFGPGAGGTDPLRARAAAYLAAAQQGALLPSTDLAVARCTPKPMPQDPAQAAEAVRPSIWWTQVSELDTLWTATSREIDAGRRAYGSLPLIVLTAD
jgi:pimeloyl-ACP methyl ester carboxylesterase